MPWKRRTPGFNARIDSLISCGNFSMGSGGGLMRLTAFRKFSSDTVGFRLISFMRLRKSISLSCFGVTKPFGIEVFAKNSCNYAGIFEVVAGASVATDARSVAFFAVALFFLAMVLSPRIFFDRN